MIKKLSFAIILSVISLILFKSEALAQVNSKPNIILILADDLGYGDVGAYGNDVVLTPNIDKLIGEGMKFTDFNTNAPVCSPTRSSILTGLYNSRFGLRWACDEDSISGLPGGIPTIANVLKDSGYGTYHIGKWHLGIILDEFLPMNRGFDHFFGFLNGIELRPEIVKTTEPATISPSTAFYNPKLVRDMDTFKQYEGHMNDLLADEASNIIRTHPKDKPFFINFWARAVHNPIDPPQKWIDYYNQNGDPVKINNMYPNPRFPAFISSLDEGIGRVLTTLKEEGLEENTIVIFTSDNGGWISTHRYNSTLKGFKSDVYQGGIQVPMAVKWPNNIPAGSQNNKFFMTMDLFPTLLDMIGIPLNIAKIDGKSFYENIKNPSLDTNHPLAFWEFQQPKREDMKYAVRQQVGDGQSAIWKYVYSEGDYGLYNLANDPSESKNLYDTRPGKVAELENLYWAWRNETSTIPIKYASLPQGTPADSKNIHFTQDSVAVIENNAMIVPTSREFSISTWIRTPDTLTTGIGNIASKKGSWELYFLNANKKMRFSWTKPDGTNLTLTSKTVLKPNKWYHILVTAKNNFEINLYVDNVLEGTIGHVLPGFNSENVYVGNSPNMARQFLGDIYDLKFFNAELKTNERAELFKKYPVLTSIKKPILGDFDSSGGVDNADYQLILSGFGTTYSIYDYNNLIANFGK